MDPDEQIDARLSRFAAHARFGTRGAVITDLDGTAVHEDATAGRVVIPVEVELALRRIRELGRPVILNSLRFPLSIMRSFGQEWCAISNAPLPTVSLNGSLVGWLTRSDSGALSFDEVAAFPLLPGELHGALERIEALLRAGLDELLVFWYPRDWTLGERIWAFRPDRLDAVRARYPSAAAEAVEAGSLEALRAAWSHHEICMALLLLDVPGERLMAYQHAERERFLTRAGVDKLHGARLIAERLQVELADSVGAGDTVMDTFLDAVGLSVTVGSAPNDFSGIHETLRVRDSVQLGRLLDRLARLHAAGEA